MYFIGSFLSKITVFVEYYGLLAFINVGNGTRNTMRRFLLLAGGEPRVRVIYRDLEQE